MAQNSTIEWTDANLPVTFGTEPCEYICLREIEHAPSLGSPPPYIAVFFRAIARRAGWGNVIRRSQAAPAYRHDVVPSRGWVGAIGALSPEHIQPVLLAFCGHWIGATLAAVGMLTALGTEALVCGVALALKLVDVLSAQSGANISDREPGLAQSAPRQTGAASCLTLGPAWPARLASVSAGFAATGKAIAPADVGPERRNRVPLFAGRTPFLSSVDPCQVLLNRQAQPGRRKLDNALFASH